MRRFSLLLALALALSAMTGGQTLGRSEGQSQGQALGQALGHGGSRHVLGRSTLGRPIVAYELGKTKSKRRVLVVGCIHGTECAGTAIAEHLLRLPAPHAADLWIVTNLNPDGYASGHRQNGRGVDLNRNFPTRWRPVGKPWDVEYSGPHPASEPETRIAMRLILRLRPRVTIWYHQHQDLVRAWDGSIPAARRYAHLVGMAFRRLPWPDGAATNWQNHHLPQRAAFVVELPAGQLTDAEVDRHARAVLRLGQ